MVVRGGGSFLMSEFYPCMVDSLAGGSRDPFAERVGRTVWPTRESSNGQWLCGEWLLPGRPGGPDASQNEVYYTNAGNEFYNTNASY